MENPFYGARLKLKRAKEHIDDLQTRAQLFADMHPHVISIKRDADTGMDILGIAPADPPPEEFTLILGDALHNLKSALDHAWFRMIRVPHSQTKFPARKSREAFDAAIKGLKENSCEEVKAYLKEVLQPYGGGNKEMIFDLHNIDIIDKHSLLIAHRQFTLITGLRAIDEREEEFQIEDWLIVPPHTAFLFLEGHSNCKITDNGQAISRVTFGKGMPFQGRYILPTLKSLTELVESVIDKFEAIFNADLNLGEHLKISQNDGELTLAPTVRQDRRDLIYFPDRIVEQ